MASVQRYRVGRHAYWRIVESRRVNGRPTIRVLAYLGKADDLLRRLQAAEALELHSRSHGAVAALYALGRQLDIAGTIDRQLELFGRRSRRRLPKGTRLPAQANDGLSVGDSLLLASIGRACHATSKRGFASWASTTTLGELAGVDVTRLTSQHVWDQMEQVPIEAIAAIEREIVDRAVAAFGLTLDTLLYDATNFFTFIATTNDRATIPARGHNKPQKRHDLRQVGVALLCTRGEQVPLWHQVYGGQLPDAKSFPEALTGMRDTLVSMLHELRSLTLVYDKGNVSRHNQDLVDGSELHYVAALCTSTQKALLAEANASMEPLRVGSQQLLAFRTQRALWGKERTLVVLLSERLRAGQKRGILQHATAAQSWLTRLKDTIDRGRCRRTRSRLQHEIDARLRGRQHLRHVLQVQLTEAGGRLQLAFSFDEQALETLERDSLGRLVLMTDRQDWSTADIIRAYRGQADVEAVFAHLKDPVHLALRPQFHWTDQKIHVHVLTCILGYLLARLLHLQAQRSIGYSHEMERLIEELERVRRVTVVRTVGEKRRPRISTQLESCPAEITPLLRALGIAE